MIDEESDVRMHDVDVESLRFGLSAANWQTGCDANSTHWFGHCYFLP